MRNPSERTRTLERLLSKNFAKRGYNVFTFPQSLPHVERDFCMDTLVINYYYHYHYHYHYH